MTSMAHEAGSGTAVEERVQLPEMAGAAAPGIRGPVWVKLTVSSALPAVKPLSVPAGVNIPVESKLTTANGAGANAKLLSKPEKLPKALVKDTGVVFVAVTVAKVTGVNAAIDENWPVELETRPAMFVNTAPGPIAGGVDATPMSALEKDPLMVAAFAVPAIAKLAVAANRKDWIFMTTFPLVKRSGSHRQRSSERHRSRSNADPATNASSIFLKYFGNFTID